MTLRYDESGVHYDSGATTYDGDGCVSTITYDETGVTWDDAVTYVGCDHRTPDVSPPVEEPQGAVVPFSLPTFQLRRRVTTRGYRVYRKTFIRVYVHVTHTDRVATRRGTVVVVKAEQSPPRLSFKTARRAELAKTVTVEKRATAESIAWVDRRNREDEAFLVGLLSR